MKRGVLLVNLGTPSRADISAVRRYLREFLLDYRVVSLNWLLRQLLVYVFILPFRAPKSTKAYQRIWTSIGSPLLTNSIALKSKLQKLLPNTNIQLAMRYGEPSIASALENLKDVSNLTILPLFPQYASATTGSIIENILSQLKSSIIFPNLKITRDFYSHPAFIAAQAKQIASHLKPDDFLLLSYHGLPQKALNEVGCHCAKKISQNCTSNIPIPYCYRKQCFTTTELIKKALNIDDARVATSFQSRLGRTPWIKPYTDEMLIKLRDQGIQNIAIACPSFVADCLETLEEIGIEAHESWLQLGGSRLTLIPCLNDTDHWVNALIDILNDK